MATRSSSSSSRSSNRSPSSASRPRVVSVSAFGGALKSFVGVVCTARSPSLKHWNEDTAKRAFGWAEYIEKAATAVVEAAHVESGENSISNTTAPSPTLARRKKRQRLEGSSARKPYEDEIERVMRVSCAKFDTSLEALSKDARAMLLRSILFSPYLSPKLAPWVKRTAKSMGKKRTEKDIVAWTRAKSIVAKAVAAETDSTPYERRIATIRKLSEALCVRLHVTQLLKRSASEKKEKQPKDLFTLKKLREHVGKVITLEVVCMALFAPVHLALRQHTEAWLLPNATKTVHLIPGYLDTPHMDPRMIDVSTACIERSSR